jgi:lipopolysaccharide/colanic/teichoic acid biosynthesis glycosyltransferase
MFFDIPIIRITNYATGRLWIFMKRLFDFVVTSIFLLFAAPFLLAIAAAIKLSSRGPVFYTQIRVGKDGREFKIYKFRSMYSGSIIDEEFKRRIKEFILDGTTFGNESHKIVNKDRITRIGRFLRKTSIDEIPQFFNVLKGEMSLVGPRPCLPYEYDMYEDWHKRRLSVYPGCTGIWQIYGRSAVGFNDMVMLDLYYIENMSPWFDLQLLLKTIPVMVFGKGGE